MNDKNYTTTFTVSQSPEEVFAAISNVGGWWAGKIQGRSDKLGAEFTHRYEDMHRSKLRVIEFVPVKKVVWHVLDSHLGIVRDTSEWKDTRICFEISKRKDGNTIVRFVHVGLAPACECYAVCSDAWGSLIKGNLRKLIVTRQGEPENGMPVGDRRERRR